MRIVLLACLAFAACKKPAPPAVDLSTVLHGTLLETPLAPPTAFKATNHDGSTRDPAALIGHPTVLWFFPAAATSGCTVEGCGYRDRYDAFQALGVEIVGVSFTPVEVNHDWVEGQGFQYEIWHDDDRALAMHYDAADDATAQYPRRRTRVLNAEGKVIIEYNDKIIVGAHPQEVLEDVTAFLSR